MEEMLTVENIFRRGNNLLVQFLLEFGYFKKFNSTILNYEKDSILLMLEQVEILPKIKLGAEMTLSYQTPNGEEYVFGTYLIKNIIKQSPLLILAEPKNVSFVSLRRFRRKAVKLSLDIILKGNYIKCLITNLSPCGLLAEINTTPPPDLTVGQELAFILNFPSQPVQLDGYIVRFEVTENGAIMALNFSNVTNQIREVIIDYILHE